MSEIRHDRPPPTDEQLRALEVSGTSVALTAGAGTGKTFVLAERFVRALEGPDALPLSRVVALTFTNKAARELRERIRRECRARFESGNDPLRWRSVLRGLEAARIGTFHSFCGDVLRRHAIEAGIDPGFSVLDESVASSVRQDSLAETLREALTRRDSDLIDLAVEYGLGMVRESIDDLLRGRSAGDIRDWASREPRELVDLWVRIWSDDVEPAIKRGFREKLVDCLNFIDKNELENPKIQARVAELREAVALFDQPGDSIKALERIGEVAVVRGLAGKLWPTLEIYEEIKDRFASIRDEIKKLKTILPWDEPATMTAAAHGLKFARLTIKARETYDRVKRERGWIDNDDLLSITRDILTAPSSAARAALADSIDLILVDEFQDTDPVQAEILECLAGDQLLSGRLFLVGDVKQSIYRFRGARPELFENYRGVFPLEGQLDLSTNFRSLPAILAFANALFVESFGGKTTPLRPGLQPLAGSERDEPAVEFLWATANATEDPKTAANSRRKDEARRIARHLRTGLDAGWMIRDPKNKSVRRAAQGDVAFLFRSLSDSSDYEQALVAEGLDYHVVGGSGFYAQQEVLDLINVLTTIEDPLDPVSLAGTLRSPFFSISDDALFTIATEKFGQPHEGLERCHGHFLLRLPEDDRPRAERARILLARWREIKDRLPIAVLVDRVLAESGYEAALIGEFLGDRKRANARKLVQMARKFDEQGGFTLADFVARLRADLRSATKETQAATTDEEGEVIRLMSIHQAKGLEFPIVVLPDLDRKRPGEMKRVAFDSELGPLVNLVIDTMPGEDGDESDAGGCLGWTIHRHRERKADDDEALRLFYVAVTRARDALIISSATDPEKRPTSPALKLLDHQFNRLDGRFIGDLPADWPEPRVRVGSATNATQKASSIGRHQPRLIEVARAIERGLAHPESVTVETKRLPHLVHLDPAFGLSSTSARLDRLIRTILEDPRALDPKFLEMIADRAGRLQDPVSPDGLIARAVERLAEWSRSPAAREIARSSSVLRAFGWSMVWPETERSTVFRGRGDFLFRGKDDVDRLAILSDPAASEASERLRLLFAARSAERMGIGQVKEAWWIRLGAKLPAVIVDQIDDAAIGRAVEELLAVDVRPI